MAESAPEASGLLVPPTGEAARRDRPTGRIALLFSDIEGSTRLLYSLRDRYVEVLAVQRRIFREAFGHFGGCEVDTQGDSFFAVFQDPQKALQAAVEVQGALATYEWPEGAAVRVRIGIHVGEPFRTADGYVGLAVHRAARLCAVGHGGMILLSEPACEAIARAAPEGTVLVDLGEHRLKDLEQPEHIYNVALQNRPEAFPALKTLSLRRTNLPSLLTRFVGRETEAAAVRALVLGGQTRLVALTGPGGTGKTRLSLEVARELLPEFPDGVYFVPLAPVRDPALVPSTIAHELSVREVAGRTILDAVKDNVGTKRMLLVLDNFEHVLPASGVVAELLTSCPNLHTLVSSRECLHITGERELAVPPLQLPARSDSSRPEAVADADAVRLLVERVRDFNPDFGVTAANAAAVHEICTQLDALPLAIELVAPRLKLLSPQGLLTRLRSRLDLVPAGGADLTPRQRTLRGAIEWSHDLLDEPERTLFRRLSVFVGGSSIETAEHVCTLAGEGPLGVFDVIASLASKSLLTIAEHDGEMRFGMLETIREYAHERLADSADEALVRRQHAETFLEIAEAAEPEVLGRRQRGWIARLVRESDNLRTALGFLLENHEGEMAGRLVHALLWFWIPQARFFEGRIWAERTLAVMGQERTIARARVLNALGFLAIFTTDYPVAARSFSEALPIFQELDARVDAAKMMTNLGISLGGYGTEAGLALMEQGLSLARETGDRYAQALALLALGEGARMQQDDERARACYEEGLQQIRAVGNMFWLGYFLQNLAHICLHRRDWKGASVLLSEALAVGTEYGYQMIILLYLAATAGVAVLREQTPAAAQLLGFVDGMLRRMDAAFQPSDQVEFGRNMAATKEALGDDVFNALFAEGAALAPDAVLAMARRTHAGA